MDSVQDSSGLAEEGSHLHIGRQPSDFSNRVLDAVDYTQGVGAGLLEDRNIDGRFAVDQHLVVLNRGGPLCAANIAKVGGRLAWADLDWDLIERLGAGNLSVGVDVPVVRTDFGIARWKDLVGGVYRVYRIVQ